MGLFTKETVKALQREARSFARDYISPRLDVTEMAVRGPKGCVALADLFASFEQAAAEVGEHKAREAAVDAARAEIATNGTGADGTVVSSIASVVDILGGSSAPADEGSDWRNAQDIAERVIRTFIDMAQSDASLPPRFRRATSRDEQFKDELELESFFGAFAGAVVASRSGDPRGDRIIEDMSTARGMYREIYDRVVADKGVDCAELATVDYARAVVDLVSAIYRLGDAEAAADATEALIRSLLADP